MTDQREFRQGDGHSTLLPDETVTLNFECRDCGRNSSVTIVGASRPTVINCDETRQCPDCEKKALVQILKEQCSPIPEDELLGMTKDQLLALHGSQDQRNPGA
jgi:rubredoxin